MNRPIYVTLNVRVELAQRTALEQYAQENGISVAEAARRAIEKLTKEDKG